MILSDEQMQALCGYHCTAVTGASRATALCRCEAIRATERAVLERLREPTLDMLHAACLAEQTADPDDNPHLVTWRAMIDAAAKGGA